MQNKVTVHIQRLLPVLISIGLAACGGSDGGDASMALATPTLSFSAPTATFDLANYVLTGRYSLPVGSGANLLAEEASAVTYNKDTGTLFVVGDGGTSVVQVTKKGELVDSMTLAADPTKVACCQGTYFYDPEGITYIGNNKFVMVEERFRQLNEFTYVPNTTLGGTGVRTVKLGTTIGNIGIEGITLDPMTNGYIGVKESGPMGVFQTTVDFAAGTASNGSPTTENSTNLFDPLKIGMNAINDVYALSNILPSSAPDYSHILILSASSGKIVKMDRSGNLLGTLDVGSSAQNEGMTMDPSGNIYVVSEIGGGAGHPEMLVFTPAASSTAVGLASNLYLRFNQTVSAGSGNIVISNGAGDTRSIAVTDTAQVSFSGTTVTINPSADLVAGTSYSVTYAGGVFKDAAGNAAPAVTGSTLGFKASGSADVIAPTLTSSSPMANATGISSSRVVLTFSEPVVAGSGNIVISSASDTRTMAVTDTTQVTFSGNTVNINPNADLQKGVSYSVTLASGVIKDVAGNPFAGITSTATLNFDTAAPVVVTPTASLLITEVNSNATGGDFFELYNYGATAIDISGWKWGDNKFSFTDSAVATFASGTVIAPGQRLLVVNADVTAFRAAWGLSASVAVARTDLAGPGLGGGDAVVLYNAAGVVVTALNYGADATGFPHATASAGTTFVAGVHAGPAFGGAVGLNSVSAVWDGVSTSAPAYKAAVVGVLGGFAQPASASAVGSPSQ
jgi:uncharacterized protein YjiK/methionine-rich copper-binding protein CopC